MIPEVNLTSFPPHWFRDPLNLQTYDYIFTGKVPQSYEQRGALRSMISSEVRDVPRAIGNSFLVATAVMLINITLGSLSAYAYARIRFPGRAALFSFVLFSRLIPTVAVAIPYYLIICSFIVLVVAAVIGITNAAIAAALIYMFFTLRFIGKRLAKTSHHPRHIVEMVVTSFAIPFLSVYWTLYGAWKYKVLYY